MTNFLRSLALISLLPALGPGCSEPAGQPCQRDDDCESGFCQADRTCGPAAPDGGAGLTVDGGPDGGAACTPDHDGTIARDEFPLVPGRVATYRVALDATVSTAGVLQPGGAHVWDLSAALPGDFDRGITLASPDDEWWADQFPGASYAAPLAADSELIGVFELTDSVLWLVGVVSPEAGTFRTELAYDPPVRVLGFPLSPGAEWTVETAVTGLAQGVFASYGERYEARVDASGTLATPYGEFPVSRVAVDLERTVGLLVTTTRTLSFVAECYATVGIIVSQTDEDSAEFTDAAEVRRLTP